MRFTIILAAAAGALALAPVAGHAQTSGETGQKLHGPPNANGYAKTGAGSVADDPAAQPEGSAKMKGPPNANGGGTGNGDAK